MRCGKGHQHQTVADVRNCYAQRDDGHYFRAQNPEDARYAQRQQKPPRTAWPEASMEEEDRYYAEIQRRERAESERVAAFKMARDEQSMRSTAKAPATDLRRPGNCDIPEGYYATLSLAGANDLDFWKVQRPEDGRWKGWTFVRRVLGGHEDLFIKGAPRKKVKSERAVQVTQVAALAAILEYGIEDSANLFADELTYCKRCGIHLTDELSRSRRIGPVCFGK